MRIAEVCRTNGIEDDYRVLLIVPGEWIIENHLTEEWKRRRGIPDSVEIRLRSSKRALPDKK